MAGTSGSKSPDMAEEFMSAAIESRKIAIENEVFEQILHYWEDLQELQLLYNSGEEIPPRLAIQLKKVREHLHIANWVDVFTDGRISQLMLRKEKKILKRLVNSDSFTKTSYKLNSWMRQWRAAVKEKYRTVTHINVYGY